MAKEKKLEDMNNEELSNSWKTRIEKYLKGRTIVKIEYCSEKESEEQGWHNQPIQILLDNGTWLTPTSDDEGNNGGAILLMAWRESCIFRHQQCKCLYRP